MFVANSPGVPTSRDTLATVCDPSGVRFDFVLWSWFLEDPVAASVRSAARHKRHKNPHPCSVFDTHWPPPASIGRDSCAGSLRRVRCGAGQSGGMFRPPNRSVFPAYKPIFVSSEDDVIESPLFDRVKRSRRARNLHRSERRIVWIDPRNPLEAEERATLALVDHTGLRQPLPSILRTELLPGFSGNLLRRPGDDIFIRRVTWLRRRARWHWFGVYAIQRSSGQERISSTPTEHCEGAGDQ